MINDFAPSMSSSVDYCGRQVKRISPNTGTIKTITWLCRNWRECEYCRNHRIDEMSKRVADDFGQDARFIKVSTDEVSAKKITRKNRNNYIRVPHEEGVVDVYIRSDDDDAKPIEHFSFLEDVCEIPERKRVTFSASNHKEKKEDPSHVVVSVPHLVPMSGISITKEMLKLASEIMTKYLVDEDGDVEDAIYKYVSVIKGIAPIAKVLWTKQKVFDTVDWRFNWLKTLELT